MLKECEGIRVLRRKLSYGRSIKGCCTQFHEQYCVDILNKQKSDVYIIASIFVMRKIIQNDQFLVDSLRTILAWVNDLNYPLGSTVCDKRDFAVILSPSLGYWVACCLDRSQSLWHFSRWQPVKMQVVYPSAYKAQQRQGLVRVSHSVLLYYCAFVSSPCAVWSGLWQEAYHVLSTVVSPRPMCEAGGARTPAYPWPVVRLVKVVRMFPDLWWRSQVSGETLQQPQVRF